MKLKRAYAGRYECGPWSVVHTDRRVWSLLYRRHDGARGEAEIDRVPTYREAKELFQQAAGHEDEMRKIRFALGRGVKVEGVT